MATKDARIAEFTTANEPPADDPVRILCEDNVGTYVVPFPCVCRDGKWFNAKTGQAIEAKVLGWTAYG